MMQATEIMTAAIRLSPSDRFVLAEQILQTLDQPDSEINKRWQDESERRLQEYRAGMVQSIPAHEVVGVY
jgi:putative addiction module component (TIGR02574 family)